MARNKSSQKKRVLYKAAKRNRRVPLFVIARTKRKVSRNRLARNWRSRKLGIKVK